MIPDFIVSEFLLWLWWISDNGSHVKFSEELPGWTYPADRPAALDLWIDGQARLKLGSSRAVFQSDVLGNDAREALRVGKSVCGIRLAVREADLEYRYSLDSGLFRFKLTPPHVEYEDATTQSAVFGTVAVVRRAEQLLDHLFYEFIQRRTTGCEELVGDLSAFIREGAVLDDDRE